MAANWVPTDQGGQFLASYDVLGLGAGASLPIEREFGNVPFAGAVNGRLISQFLQGVRQSAGNAVANTAFVGVPNRSRDDTSANKSAIEGMLSKAGLVGTMLPNLGQRSTATGNRNQPAVVVPPAPLVVNNTNAIASSLGYAGALGNTLNANQKAALARLINNLSTSQSKRLMATNSGADIKKVLDCAGVKNADLISKGAQGVDPRQDTAGATLNTIWGINNNTAANNANLVMASMVYNVLKGQAGAATLDLGGYDYHDGSRTTGDRRDLDAGVLVGRVLASAQALQSPVFIYVTSDGAVSGARSNSPDTPWRSDRGNGGAAYMMFFSPQGRRQTSSNQIGWFTAGQEADSRFVTGGSPEAAAAAVFANYLQLNNKLSMFSQVVPNTIPAADLDKVLRFG